MAEAVSVVMCADCAFRPGTPASRDEEVRAGVMACALQGTDFFCHHDLRPCRGWLAFKAEPVQASGLLRGLVAV
jgi:hypothetical protein